jgi:hypothetical protein
LTLIELLRSVEALVITPAFLSRFWSAEAKRI